MSTVMLVLDSGVSLKRLKVLLSCSELEALSYILQSFAMLSWHRKFKWFSDSQNVCRIVSVGSST